MSIHEYLVSLGDSAEEIAASLHADGIHGCRGSAYHCPLAVGINVNCETWPGLKVSPGGFVGYGDSQIIDPQSTKAAGEFVKRFDMGEFREVYSVYVQNYSYKERDEYIKGLRAVKEWKKEHEGSDDAA